MRRLVGSVTIRTSRKTGKQRAWVKVAEPNAWKLRAVLVWEAVHGPLPRGMLVHHRDRNTLNDAPRNLQALTRSKHINEHRMELMSCR